MLLIIPVVSPDRSCSIPNLIDAMERACQKFPPGANHTLLVVASPDAKSYSEVLVNKLQPYFAQSSSETFVANHSLGWPRENNFYFQQSCFLLPKYVKPNQGFLYMELDCVPLTANWLTLIEQEYYADSINAHREGRNVRRFMGSMEDPVLSKRGERVTGETNMSPSGVYSGELFNCPLLNSLSTVDQHFSVRLKWMTTIAKGQQVLNVSPLFQNNKQTVKYREESGEIVCDSLASNAWGVHWNNPISQEAVLLQGCLDGSLIDLISVDRAVSLKVAKAQVQSIPTPAKPKESKMFVQLPAPTPTPFPNLTSMNPVQSLLNRGVPPTQVPRGDGINPLRVGEFKPTVSSYAEHRKLQAEQRNEESPQEAPAAESPEDEMVFYAPPTEAPKDMVPFDEDVSAAPQSAPAPPVNVDPKPFSKKKGPRKLNLSPEERRRRSEAAKARFHAKKAEPVAA